MGSGGGNIAAASLLTSSVSTIGNTYARTQAIRAEANFQRSQLEMNRKIAEMQANDALRRGAKEKRDVETQTRQLIGAQRAAMAAQGIEVDTGSALDIQKDTATLGRMDALTVRMNAYREAWGYKFNAMQMTAQGELIGTQSRFARSQALVGAGQSLAGAGLTYAASRAQNRRTTTSPVYSEPSFVGGTVNADKYKGYA